MDIFSKVGNGYFWNENLQMKYYLATYMEVNYRCLWISFQARTKSPHSLHVIKKLALGTL